MTQPNSSSSFKASITGYLTPILNIFASYLHCMIVVVNDAYNAPGRRLSATRRWCFVSDGGFSAETRDCRWPALPTSDAASNARTTSAASSAGTRVPGVTLLSVACRLLSENSRRKKRNELVKPTNRSRRFARSEVRASLSR